MEETLDGSGKGNRKANPEAFRRHPARGGPSLGFTVGTACAVVDLHLWSVYKLRVAHINSRERIMILPKSLHEI